MGYLTEKGLTLKPNESPGPDNQILFLTENLWIRYAKGGSFSGDDRDHFARAVDLITHQSHDNLVAKYSGMWLLGLHGKSKAEWEKDLRESRFRDNKIDQPSHVAFYKHCVPECEPSCMENIYLKAALSISLLHDMEERSSEILLAWVMLRTLSAMGRHMDVVYLWAQELPDKGGIHKAFTVYFKEQTHPNREDSDGIVF